VATADGWPALLVMPEFVSGQSHGYPEFIDGCDAVVMGRNTFVPALGALDRLEIVVLPTLLGTGVPLSPAGSPSASLRLLPGQRTFPDGAIELVYSPA
jgi:hypothetical protein